MAQEKVGTQTVDGLDALVRWVRVRNDLRSEEGDLSRRIKSIKRREASEIMNPTLSMSPARLLFEDMLSTLRHDLRDAENTIKKLVSDMPEWGRCSTLPLSEVSFAQLVAGSAAVIGENGNGRLATPADYDNPAKLWCRWGVGLKLGEIQRKSRDKDKAKAMRFSPFRRRVLWAMGDMIIKNNKKDARCGHYYAIYLERKEYEFARLPEKKGRKGHAANRAKRYMEKRLLRDFWKLWHGNAA